MTAPPTKLQRWLDVIAYLVGRRLPVSVDELMRAVPAYAQRWQSDSATDQQTARRTFERDKDELRRLGIPIRTVKYVVDWGGTEEEGYAIERRDFYLPYLKLVQGAVPASQRASRHRPASVEIDVADAPLALEALRRVADVPGFPLLREARSAFRKLAFDIDPRAFSRTDTVLFAEQPGTAELADRLRTLSDALLARKHVRFRYHGIYRGAETARTVDGYGLLLQHGHWYFVGHDQDRADTRVFRVGRMEDVVANTKSRNRPDYRIPQEFRLDAYVGRQAWELGAAEEEAIIARVLFPFPLSLWAERNAHGELDVRREDGATVRTFTVHQVGPFLRWLLSLEGDATLLEPPALVDELQALVRGVASAHGDAYDDG